MRRRDQRGGAKGEAYNRGQGEEHGLHRRSPVGEGGKSVPPKLRSEATDRWRRDLPGAAKFGFSVLNSDLVVIADLRSYMCTQCCRETAADLLRGNRLYHVDSGGPRSLPMGL